MNYNNKYPTFSFRIDHNSKVKLDKLAVIKKISTNEFARKVITMYLKNELVEKTEDLQTEKIKLQIAKLKAEIKYMEIKNNYFEAFNKPMSRSATVHIKPEIIVETPKKEWMTTTTRVEAQQSPYDAKNKRLQCIDCQHIFRWRNYTEYSRQIVEFQRHLKSTHNREMTPLERDVILMLNFEGEST